MLLWWSLSNYVEPVYGAGYVFDECWWEPKYLGWNVSCTIIRYCCCLENCANQQSSSGLTCWWSSNEFAEF